MLKPKVTFVRAMISYRIKSETGVLDNPFGVVGLRRGKKTAIAKMFKVIQTSEVDVKRITFMSRKSIQCSYFPTGPVSTVSTFLFKDDLATCNEIDCTVHLPSVSEFPSQTTSLVMGLIYVSRSFGGGKRRGNNRIQEGGREGK